MFSSYTEVPASITVCVTSCGRVDLLEITLKSFQKFNKNGNIIISEDSADPAVIQKIETLFPEVHVISANERIGQMKSIDRLYSAVTTPYIFHLEDDWEFTGSVNWSSALTVLENRQDISNICVRQFDEIKSSHRNRSDFFTMAGRDYRRMRENAHHEFFGWSPNPGLIRRDLFLSYRPLSAYHPDKLSEIIKSAGQTMAFQLPGVAGHIGQGRNVNDPTLPPRPKSRILKFFRKIKKQLYYIGLRKNPY